MADMQLTFADTAPEIKDWWVDALKDNKKDYNALAVRRSPIDRPTWQEMGGMSRLLLFLGSTADEITPWSINSAARDKQLREFWKAEPTLASTVYAVSARTAGFKWEIVASDPTKDKPVNTIAAVTEMLQNSNLGQGWESLILEWCQDIFTQDNGAFISLIRAEDNPASPVLCMEHLDAAVCFRTGDPAAPVIYTDRNGGQHVLKWYQVIALSEMPAADEQAYGTQICAVSRVLRAAQILRNIATYKYEKVSGQFVRTVHFLSGVTEGEIEDGMAWAREQAMNSGARRYSQPVIIPGIDPSNPLSHVQIDLASLPDAFDEDSTFKWYIAQLALGFGVDYQELAPLPGGNLGSSQQSQILHMKTQGKGPALIMSLIEHMINNSRVIPRTVKFQFKEHDLRADLDRANAGFIRSKDRVMQTEAGILDTQAARDLSVLEGDLPEYIANQVQERGVAAPRPTKPEVSSAQVSGGTQSQEEQPVAGSNSGGRDTAVSA